MTSILNAIVVPIDQVHAHERNPRLDLDGIDGLARSISAAGIIQPLIVTARTEGGYTIIAGHRRHAAAKVAGLDEVPCVVTDTDDVHQVVAMLHENDERDGLTEAERAQGIQAALDLGANITDLAKGLGLSRKEVNRYKGAAGFDDTTKDAMHALALTLDEAMELAEFATHPQIHQDVIKALSEGGNNPVWVFSRARDQIEAARRMAIVEAYADEHDVAFTEKHSYDRNVQQLRGDDIATHYGLDCYAVSVDRYGDDPITHLCVKANVHATGADGSPIDQDEAKAAKSAERRRVIANNKVWLTVTDIRAQWVATLRDRKSAPKGALPHVVAMLAYMRPEASHYTNAMKVMDPTIDNWWNVTIDKTTAAITTDAQAIRALLLVMIDAIEADKGNQTWRSSSDSFAHYLTLLASWGYVLTPPEQVYIDRVTSGQSTTDVDYPGTDIEG